MIKINLLPPAYRVVKKKKVKKAVTSSAEKSAPVVMGRMSTLPWKTIAIAGGAIFFLLTIYFYVDFIKIRSKLKSLNAEMTIVNPQTQSLRALEQEVSEKLFPEKNFLMTHVLNKAPITFVLQRMNDALPEGVWLERFSMKNTGKDRSFNIQGVALNIENKTNIEQIEEYLQSLKQVIATSQFTYATAKQLVDGVAATSFNAEYKWQAD